MQLSCDRTLLPPNDGSGSYTCASYNMSANVVRFDYRWDNIFAGKTGLPPLEQSPVFRIDARGQTRWSLRLYPHGVDLESKHVSLFLCCESSNKTEVQAKFRFCTEFYSDTVTSTEMNKYCVFKCGTEMACQGYKDFSSIKQFSESNWIRIECDIEMRLINSNIVDQCAGQPSKAQYHELRDDIAAVFTTEKHTDFIIICGGISFPVHKVILSARSPVFASMFEHDTKEQRENCVVIEDMKPAALKEMLRFIYTDKVIGIETVALYLLPAAEKYALDKLKVMCEEALYEILAVENAADVLNLADLFRAVKLKMRAIHFIIHQTADVMETSGFKEITTSNPRLITEILRASLTRNK